MTLEEEMDKAMQGFVMELEGKWGSKIQREAAMERGGLGSQAGCGLFFIHSRGIGLSS